MRVVEAPATVRSVSDEVLYILEKDEGIHLPAGAEVRIEERATVISVSGGQAILPFQHVRTGKIACPPPSLNPVLAAFLEERLAVDAQDLGGAGVVRARLTQHFADVARLELLERPLLLGGGFDEEGVARFGLAIQSVPARLAPVALRRVLDHFIQNREAGESFRQYVLRNKVETFRALTAEFAKPAELFPEIYQDWGDDAAFSLQLGRGECAA